MSQTVLDAYFSTLLLLGHCSSAPLVVGAPFWPTLLPNSTTGSLLVYHRSVWNGSATGGFRLRLGGQDFSPPPAWRPWRRVMVADRKNRCISIGKEMKTCESTSLYYTYINISGQFSLNEIKLELSLRNFILSIRRYARTPKASSNADKSSYTSVYTPSWPISGSLTMQSYCCFLGVISPRLFRNSHKLRFCAVVPKYEAMTIEWRVVTIRKNSIFKLFCQWNILPDSCTSRIPQVYVQYHTTGLCSDYWEHGESQNHLECCRPGYFCNCHTDRARNGFYNCVKELGSIWKHVLPIHIKEKMTEKYR